MPKRILRLFLLFMVFSGTLFSNQVLSLAIGEWAPYTSQKDPKGKMAEIIVFEAFKLENIDVVYKYYPWKRAFELVARGDEVGTFPWYITPSREKEFIISKEAIIVSKTVFFHLKSLDLQWTKYEDLKKYKIGGILGYSYTQLLKNKGLKVEEVPREELNFKKLLKNRIDLIPSDFFVGYNIINKIFEPNKAALFTNHPTSILHDGMYMLISKKNPDAQVLANKFDKGLIQLKKSGRYDKIILEFMTK